MLPRWLDLAAGKPQRLPVSHLLLAGGGHSHALLLRQWAMRPSTRPGVEAITLVSAQPTSLYSGLIPACLSGAVAPEACVLDVWGLCRAAASTLCRPRSWLGRAKRQLSLKGDRPPLSYDWLSLNLGAEVRAGGRAAYRSSPWAGAGGTGGFADRRAVGVGSGAAWKSAASG